MAFSISGIFTRICRFSEPQFRVSHVPGFYGLGSLLPDTDVQVRGYAARKGTREKALRKKRAMKMKKAAQAAHMERKMKMSVPVSNIKKTVECNLPPVPKNYDVYFTEFYKPRQQTITEAVEEFRQDLHHTVLNKHNAKIETFIELDMVDAKKTKTVTPWKTLLKYPNNFDVGFKKRVLVFCMDTFIQEALDMGADAAGGVALIKKIKKGEYDAGGFDRIIGQLELYEEINTIRSKLKANFPKPTNGTLTKDFLAAIEKFKYGVDYSCNLSLSETNFGWIDTPIGTLDMDNSKLEENFLSLVSDIMKRKPERPGDFITHVWLQAPPSRERLKISLEPYLERIAQEKENIEEDNKKREEKVSAVGG